MNSNTQTKTIAQVKQIEITPASSRGVGELMSLAGHNLWDFAVLGQAPMPKEAVRLGDWLLVPSDQDSSEIPDRALARVQAIYAAGIRPKGFVLVHEAPMLLSAPEDAREPQSLSPQWMVDPQTTQKLIDTLSFGVAGLAKVMVGIATVAVAVGSMILPAILFAGAMLLDPILIAVTEDDYWIEIDRWWV